MSKVMAAWAVGVLICAYAGVATGGVCSIAVSPLTLEVQMDPGRAYTGTIEITNAGEGTEHIRAYSQDWTLKPDGVVIFLDAGRLPDSASGWVQLAPAEFDLPPGQTQQIRYTVRVPEEAAGEARTVLLFEAAPRELSVFGAPSRLIPRVGTIMYIQCGPRPPARARVVEFDVGTDGGILVTENVGAAHLRFTGQLEIRSGDRLVRTRQLNGFVVLPPPFNVRRVRLAPEDFAELPAGTYQVIALLDHGGSALLGTRTNLVVKPERPVVIASEK